jgi:hypothetical protein
MSLSSVSSSVSDDFWDANIEADLENMLWYGYGYQSWHDILSDIHIIILLEDIYVYIYTHTLYDYILQYDYIILYLYFPIDECVYIYIFVLKLWDSQISMLWGSAASRRHIPLGPWPSACPLMVVPHGWKAHGSMDPMGTSCLYVTSTDILMINEWSF